MKGVARRVVIVRSPPESVFEQAIFIVREDVARSGGVSREEVLNEARRPAGPAAAALEALGLPRGLALRPGARPGHHPHMTREMRLDT